MPVTIAHRSPQSACKAVETAAKGEFDHLVARPWNRFEPDTSLWWLVPANEWPAFAYGKLVFDWAGENRTRLRVGVHWEKGLDPSVSSVYDSAKGLRQIMRPDWQWHRMLKSVVSGQLAQTTRELVASVDAPILLRLVGSYVENLTDFDPYNSLLKADDYWLEWVPARQEFILRQALPEGYVLGDISQVKTFEELSIELKRLTGNAWLWVNLYYYLEFPIANDANTWTGAELWTHYLRRFRQLLI